MNRLEAIAAIAEIEEAANKLDEVNSLISTAPTSEIVSAMTAYKTATEPRRMAELMAFIKSSHTLF